MLGYIILVALCALFSLEKCKDVLNQWTIHHELVSKTSKLEFKPSDVSAHMFACIQLYDVGMHSEIEDLYCMIGMCSPMIRQFYSI